MTVCLRIPPFPLNLCICFNAVCLLEVIDQNDTITLPKESKLGGSTGLVVMGDNLCSRSHRFESSTG